LYEERLKGTVPVYGWIEGPLSEACDLAGISEMLTNVMNDPDFSCPLMDKCMLTAKDFAKAQIEARRRFIFSGGCEITVDTPIVNLRVLREASQQAPHNGIRDAF
jgi:uroporphyrinogen-III decarboxylase